MEEPQTSKDAEIEALRREVETLTEALKIQQPQNRVGETNFEESFENPFAQPHHWRQEWGNHRSQTTNLGSRHVKEVSDLQFTIPGPHHTQDHRVNH